MSCVPYDVSSFADLCNYELLSRIDVFEFLQFWVKWELSSIKEYVSHPIYKYMCQWSVYMFVLVCRTLCVPVWKALFSILAPSDNKLQQTKHSLHVETPSDAAISGWYVVLKDVFRTFLWFKVSFSLIQGFLLKDAFWGIKNILVSGTKTSLGKNFCVNRFKKCQFLTRRDM